MIDISSEIFREYQYDRGVYKIDDPVELHVTESGSHRVIDRNGTTHRPATDWLAVRWKPKDGEPAFVA